MQSNTSANSGTTQNSTHTIFLTEQETTRIRTTIKTRLQKCTALTNQPREPRDAIPAIQQATGASLMVDMGGAQAADPDVAQTSTGGSGSGDKLPILAVGQPYPPCAVSMRDLVPMKLDGLKLDSHHRGFRLVVRRVSPVVMLSARSWTMVQDYASGEGEEERAARQKERDTERLEVCLHTSRFGEDVLEEGDVFVIKEPCFTITEQGEATIRVDHPSDLVLLREEDVVRRKDLIPDSSDADTAAATESLEKKALAFKERGNTALKQQQLPLAHFNYTQGIHLAKQDAVVQQNPDLARDISRNRAYVNLLLRQYDEAKSDAKASLTNKEDKRSKDLDSKACFRAGCAAYSLEEYNEAKRLFEQQLQLTPGDKDARTYLKKIETRLQEQEHGAYNWTKIRATLSRARPYVDAADFTNKTVVKESAGRGRGLFAACDIPAGEIVMCEKAFCVVWGHEREASLTAMTYDIRDELIRFSPVGLSKAVVQKLLSNPSQMEIVMNLYGDYQGTTNNVPATQDGIPVDTFRVHDIVSRNGFGLGNPHSDEGVSTGIWLHSAYINHSCIPNTQRDFTGDMIALRSLRPITAGEELFQTYDASPDYEARQTNLKTTWGFECDCAVCVAEAGDDPAIRKKRAELAKEADMFVEREPLAGAKRLVIVKARRLERAIDATYDGERWEGVPRGPAAARIKEWIAHATRK